MERNSEHFKHKALCWIFRLFIPFAYYLFVGLLKPFYCPVILSFTHKAMSHPLVLRIWRDIQELDILRVIISKFQIAFVRFAEVRLFDTYLRAFLNAKARLITVGYLKVVDMVLKVEWYMLAAAILYNKQCRFRIKPYLFNHCHFENCAFFNLFRFEVINHYIFQICHIFSQLFIFFLTYVLRRNRVMWVSVHKVSFTLLARINMKDLLIV